MFPSSLMMIMMSGTKVFNKSAKRNFHQRESHDDEEDDNEIATIYYYSGKEIIRVRQGTPETGPIFLTLYIFMAKDCSIRDIGKKLYVDGKIQPFVNHINSVF